MSAPCYWKYVTLFLAPPPMPSPWCTYQTADTEGRESYTYSQEAQPHPARKKTWIFCAPFLALKYALHLCTLAATYHLLELLWCRMHLLRWKTSAFCGHFLDFGWNLLDHSIFFSTAQMEQIFEFPARKKTWIFWAPFLALRYAVHLIICSATCRLLEMLWFQKHLHVAAIFWILG